MEDTLTHYRRVLGDDHPSTLRSANNLAADLRALGEHQQARQREEWIKLITGRDLTPVPHLVLTADLVTGRPGHSPPHRRRGAGLVH